MANSNDLPIDKGWAWIIALASAGLFGFVTSESKCQGIIIVEMQELYPDVPVQKILWLFSMAALFNRFSAPLNGMLLIKTSHRALGLTGSTLMSLCLITFAFLPQLDYMYLVYGLGYGVGSGMVTLTAVTAYSNYFDKKKAFSLGLTAAGSGIMTIIVPNLLRLLFDNFTFSNAILLYAGLCLQCVLLASLLRPIEYYQKFIELRSHSSSSNSSLTTEGSGTKQKIDQNHLNIDFRDKSLTTGADYQNFTRTRSKFLSAPTILSHSRGLSPEIVGYSLHDITTSGLLLDQHLANNNLRVKASKKILLNWKINRNPRFLLLSLAIFVFFAGVCMTYQCIPPLGGRAGVSKSFLTIAIAGAGGLEIPMKLFHGWLADRKLVSAYTHITLCMAFTGACAILCAVISSHTGIIIMLVGMSCAGTSVLTILPIASVELLGKENLCSAMSLNYFYQGISLIISTFSTAAIYESTKRWENVFFYIGSCHLLGALTMVITAVASGCFHRHKTVNDVLLDK